MHFQKFRALKCQEILGKYSVGSKFKKWKEKIPMQIKKKWDVSRNVDRKVLLIKMFSSLLVILSLLKKNGQILKKFANFFFLIVFFKNLGGPLARAYFAYWLIQDWVV